MIEHECSLLQFQNQDVILVRGVPKEDWELDHAMVTTGKKLGAGAFGVVRRGVLRKDGNDTNVAIKVCFKLEALYSLTLLYERLGGGEVGDFGEQ